MQNPNKPNPNRVKCDICNIWCPDNVSFFNHIQGKPHCKVLAKHNEAKGTTDNSPRKRKVGENSSEYHCYQCNVNCTNVEQLEAHLVGSRHLKKLRLSDNICQQYPHIETLPEEKGYKCTLCSVDLTSPSTIKTHVEGAKHLKKLAPTQNSLGNTESSPEQLTCKVCNIFANSASQLELHVASSKHIKKMLSRAKTDSAIKQSVKQNQPYDAWNPRS